MADEKSDDYNLAPDIDKINERLRQLDHPKFSDKAFEKLRKTISNYILDLIYESTTTSLRHIEDTISESDVKTANRYLVSHSKRERYKIMGNIGGILFGAALGAYFSFSSVVPATDTKTIVILGIGLLGVVLIGLSYALDT